MSEEASTLKFASDYVSIISLFISTFLAVSIFYLSKRYEKKMNQENKKFYTVVWSTDLFYRIDKAVFAKIDLEGPNPPKQTFEYISNNKKIEGLVFIILNQYSALGRALKDDLVDLESIIDVRGEAIKYNWNFYKDYIDQCTIKSKKEGQKKNAAPWGDFKYLFDEVKLFEQKEQSVTAATETQQ